MLSNQLQQMTVDFPLEHVQTGVPLGNGFLGLSVWGSGNFVNLTIGCSALWDHQGGERWQPEQSYANVCAALAAQDIQRMEQMFPGYDLVPSIIPVGRVVLPLQNPQRIILNYVDALLQIVGAEQVIEIRLSSSQKGIFAIHGASEFRLVSGYDLAPVLSRRGFPPPDRMSSGFLQRMPADPAYGVQHHSCGEDVFFQFFRNAPPSAEISLDWATLTGENQRYWGEFWENVPEIDLENEAINRFYCRSLFHFQSMTAPDGSPAGLQGPWIEDDSLPPWSADYHFNINVEMCYWPACRFGLFDNLKPLFNMMEKWKETMRQNAKFFVGIEDGYTMPHAVDDRCVNMGGFWAGTMDHACSGWMAIMMYEYFRYSGDCDFLERFGFDFMRGTMRVYEAMLQFDGQKYTLPFETSPEFRGSAIDACGQNPSFHLAVIHRLLSDLSQAAQVLKTTLPESWAVIREKLPCYSECDGEIALWNDLILPESHRHHSHLAGIFPFDCGGIPEAVRKKSEYHWIALGMGNWAGWSMPWAIMLHNRFGNAEMANLLMQIWQEVYTNQGGRTLHSPIFSGFSVIWGSNRIMQMDAEMGMLTAISDLFLYEEQDVLEIFHGIPLKQKHFSCKNLVAPYGIRFSGNEQMISFKATRDAKLKIRFPQRPGSWQDAQGKRYLPGEIFSCQMKSGEQLEWSNISSQD